VRVKVGSRFGDDKEGGRRKSLGGREKRPGPGRTGGPPTVRGRGADFHALGNVTARKRAEVSRRRAEEVLANHAIGGRIGGKADGRRRPEVIPKSPEE